jgi:sarcosine oxidase subunit beta
VALPDQAAVVIVGGGVMGTSIAFHLAEAGVPDILLLEQGQLGSGSTCKAAGGVRAQFSDPVNIALGLRGLDAFERFPERPGQEIDLRQPGYLFLLTTPEQVAAYEGSVAVQNSMGVPSRILSPQEAVALSPAIEADGLLAAAFHQRDGYCSPESVVLGYATGARRHGATIRTGVAVTGIRTDGAEITAVDTDQGTVRAGTVVCAAGAWSREVGAMAGVDLPVEPLRRQILISEPLPSNLLAVLPDTVPMTIDAGTTFYFHREGPGLLLGMSYQDEEPGFRPDYSEAWLPALMEAMAHRAPALLDLGIAHRITTPCSGSPLTCLASSTPPASPGTASCRARRWARSSGISTWAPRRSSTWRRSQPTGSPQGCAAERSTSSDAAHSSTPSCSSRLTLMSRPYP